MDNNDHNDYKTRASETRIWNQVIILVFLAASISVKSWKKPLFFKAPKQRTILFFSKHHSVPAFKKAYKSQSIVYDTLYCYTKPIKPLKDADPRASFNIVTSGPFAQ